MMGVGVGLGGEMGIMGGGDRNKRGRLTSISLYTCMI